MADTTLIIDVIVPPADVIVVDVADVGVPGPAREGVPPGGEAGQVLAKIDAADFNTEWVNQSGGGGGGGPVAWTDITGKPSTFPPTLPIAQSGVTNLVTDLAAKAPLASPALTGTPVAPTQSLSDNSTAIATTAWVKGQGYGAGGGGISDAPNDGKPYVRKSLGWDDFTDDLAGKANASHTHAQSDVTNLVTDLAARELTSNKGAANGYASLDASSKVPAGQLPSYVDDVLEFANLAAFPATGTAGIIYIALDTNRTYRWGGSSYTEISPSPGSTDAVPEGSLNLYFTAGRASAAAPVQSVATRTGAVVLTKTDVGLGNVDNTADTAKPVSTAQQTALNLKADLAGPVFTGDARAVTPATSDNDTSIATTAYVKAQGYVTSSGVTAVTGTAPVVSSGGNTPAISMAAATASVDGYLTAANFTAFAAKVTGVNTAKITVASSAPGSPATGDLWVDTT